MAEKPFELGTYYRDLLQNPASDPQVRNEALQELRRREEARTALGWLGGIILGCMALTFAAQLLIEETTAATHPGGSSDSFTLPDGGTPTRLPDGGATARLPDGGTVATRGAAGPAADGGAPDGGAPLADAAAESVPARAHGIGHAWGGAAAALLWCVAWLAVGCLFGFLFGIPKIFQPANNTPSTDPAHAALYRQAVNTNLGEISDWLTKIFVGLGLVELKRVPDGLASITGYMTLGRCALTCVPLAGAVVIAFAVLGFLCGYLATRLFLAPAFGRADTADPLQSRAPLRAPPIVRADASAAGEAATKTAAPSPDVAAAEERVKSNLRDLGRVQLRQDQFAAAVKTYASLAASSDDPLAHFEYASALSRVEGYSSPRICAELEKAAEKASSLDPQTREDLFAWLTFAFLYRTESQGYLKSIQYGEQALEMGLKSGSIYVNLACAYAQAFGATPDPGKNVQKEKVLKYIKLATGEGTAYRDRLRELLINKPDKPKGDDDLEVFEDDAQVRAALQI